MTTEANLLHGIVHDRIRVLLKQRQWFRDNRWADWPDIRNDGEVELRALVRLAGRARREALGFVLVSEQADSLTAAKGYQDWTESEKAYGR